MGLAVVQEVDASEEVMHLLSPPVAGLGWSG